MFLAAAATFTLAFAQSGLQSGIVLDQYGNLVGQLAGNGISIDTANVATVSVNTYTSAPSGVTMSPQAPAFTASPTTVNVKVPASTPIAFCSSGNTYNKATGLCSDGKFPYKVVPANSLSDPAAQNPTIVCNAPTVPTWNPAMKKWNCIVPTGFKLSLGN